MVRGNEQRLPRPKRGQMLGNSENTICLDSEMGLGGLGRAFGAKRRYLTLFLEAIEEHWRFLSRSSSW